MINPTLDEIAAHCKQAINMALNKDGETSYTLSFDVRATEKQSISFVTQPRIV